MTSSVLPKGFIFDLDGTLYNTKALDRANRLALLEVVADSRSVSLEAADGLLTEALGEFGKFDGRPSLYAAALKLGVADDKIEKAQLKWLVPEKLLSFDGKLVQLLENLSSGSRLALLTNTRTAIAERALLAIGLPLGLLNPVLGGDVLDHPKPSVEDLTRIRKFWNFSAGQCVSVGDRWAVDLKPAAEVGMKIKLVADRDELVVWLADGCPL